MSGSKSIFWSKAELDEVLGATNYAPVTPLFIALWTATLDDTSTGATAGEASYGSYARVSHVNNTTNWPNSTGTTIASKSSGIAFTFPTSTSGTNTITFGCIVDSASGAGNILYWFSTASTVINNGDTPKFNSGAITVTED